MKNQDLLLIGAIVGAYLFKDKITDMLGLTNTAQGTAAMQTTMQNVAAGTVASVPLQVNASGAPTATLSIAQQQASVGSTAGVFTNVSNQPIVASSPSGTPIYAAANEAWFQNMVAKKK